MDLVSPILDILTRLSDCTSEPRRYICRFKEELLNLTDVMRRLQAEEESVRSKVEYAEEHHYRFTCTERVERWLWEVNTIREEVEVLRRRGEEEILNKCLVNCCPRNCLSRYKLGKEISMKTAEVRRLRSEGHFEFVPERIPRPPVDEILMDETVGLDSTFTQLWSCFQDKKDASTQVIGLFGMGGVGKTTLLKKLNNEFLCNSRADYNVVIWVDVSREVNFWKIQEVIREKLEIPDGMWKDKVTDHQRADEILRFLRRKSFLLLLDDVWEYINLLSLGIPLDNTNGSKIVFTTRKEEVCGLMYAHKRFRVECLSAEASMDLFRRKVGEDVLNSHPEMPKLAETVVQECKGLPLALVTVGGAMSNWRTPEEWQRQIKVLQSYPFDIAGMEDLVFRRLKYSYDSLSDEILKNCFLYCSLFPEDHNILKDELIELWIGEGF